MKFTPINRAEIQTYKKTKWQESLEEFVRSGLDCAIVDDFGRSSVASAASAANQCAKRFGFRVKAISSRGRLIFMKMEG